jgi:hypothetical protein
MSKRVPEGHSELSLFIPREMKVTFKSMCALRETTMSEVVKQLIANWIQEQRKDYD